MVPPVKTILASTAAAVVVLAAGVAPAEAATPCWKRLFNDWVDGRIEQTYPPRCYQEANRHIPPDAKIYSSAEDDFRRALALAVHTRSGGPGSGFGSGSEEQITISPSSGSDDEGGGGSGGGPLRSLLDWFGPSNAQAVPTPLLVLAGIALLLLASAAASFLARRIQARRNPAPAAARPPRQT